MGFINFKKFGVLTQDIVYQRAAQDLTILWFCSSLSMTMEVSKIVQFQFITGIGQMSILLQFQISDQGKEQVLPERL